MIYWRLEEMKGGPVMCYVMLWPCMVFLKEPVKGCTSFTKVSVVRPSKLRQTKLGIFGIMRRTGIGGPSFPSPDSSVTVKLKIKLSVRRKCPRDGNARIGSPTGSLQADCQRRSLRNHKYTRRWRVDLWYAITAFTFLWVSKHVFLHLQTIGPYAAMREHIAIAHSSKTCSKTSIGFPLEVWRCTLDERLCVLWIDAILLHPLIPLP